MNRISPYYLIVMWALAVLMAGAIALGPAYIFGVGGAIIVHTVAGILL